MLRMHEVIDQSIMARLDELLSLARAQGGGVPDRARAEGAG